MRVCARKGFSLVELLVSVSILAVVSAAAIPMMSAIEDGRKLAESERAMETFADALSDAGARAGTMSFLAAGDSAASDAFTDADKREQVLRSMPRGDFNDAFGTPMRIYSTYDDATLTGVVVVYVAGEETADVGGATLNTATVGGRLLFSVVFNN